MGNVSYLVPSIHPMIQVAPGRVSIHTPEFATPAPFGRSGDRAVIDGRPRCGRRPTSGSDGRWPGDRPGGATATIAVAADQAGSGPPSAVVGGA